MMKALTIIRKDFNPQPKLNPIPGSAETLLVGSLGQKCPLISFLSRATQAVWFLVLIFSNKLSGVWSEESRPLGWSLCGSGTSRHEQKKPIGRATVFTVLNVAEAQPFKVLQMTMQCLNHRTETVRMLLDIRDKIFQTVKGKTPVSLLDLFLLLSIEKKNTHSRNCN